VRKHAAAAAAAPLLPTSAVEQPGPRIVITNMDSPKQVDEDIKSPFSPATVNAPEEMVETVDDAPQFVTETFELDAPPSAAETPHAVPLDDYGDDFDLGEAKRVE
jgi:hypothetical protein